MRLRPHLQHLSVLLILGMELAAQQPAEPATPKVPVTAREAEKGVRIKMPDAHVEDIMALYGQLTGKRVTRDPKLVDATVSLTTDRHMTRAEAIQFVESTLSLAGYSFTPSGENAVTLVDLQQGKRPAQKNLPKRFFTAPTPPAASASESPKQP